MPARCAVVLALIVLPAVCGDWNSKLAADYLDSRQKQWLAWAPAMRSGSPCVSCHTGLTYLLARPALRHAVGETEPTQYESALLNSLRGRVAKTDPKELFPGSKEQKAAEALGVEAILAALFLGSEQALDRMWSLQLKEGDSAGAWTWNEFNLDPWETPQSAFFGASLAAMATSQTSKGYRERPDVSEHIAALTAYLRRAQSSQPLHNRVVLLWAASKDRSLVSDEVRKNILDEVWRAQASDGGWSLEGIGHWIKHSEAPPQPGSNSYATGLVAFALEQAGIDRSDRRLARALDWLRAQQNREAGYWAAESMNKPHTADSMPALFMRDAATAFAALALVDAEPVPAQPRTGTN